MNAKMPVVLTLALLSLTVNLLRGEPRSSPDRSRGVQPAETQVLVARIFGRRRVASPRIQPTVSTFAVATLEELRERATKATKSPKDADADYRVSTETPPRWTKSSVDPGRLFDVFQPLHLKKGVVLRAYQWTTLIGSNGVVWALPIDAEYPEPDKCLQVQQIAGIEFTVPKPPAALDSIMGQVEGDGAAWSYMAASLLGRQIQEFGADWHGLRWTTHTILDGNPLNANKAKEDADGDRTSNPSGKPEEWKWLEAEPRDWRPRVVMEHGRVTVIFYTYSGFQQEAIHRHIDVYTPGNYRYNSYEKPIAEGPMGYVF